MDQSFSICFKISTLNTFKELDLEIKVKYILKMAHDSNSLSAKIT